MRACPHCRIVLTAEAAACPRDGYEPVDVSLQAVDGPLAERFSVREPFAAGGTGDLYLAEERPTDRRGLLKLVRLGPSVTPGERARLKRELLKQATITHESLSVPLATHTDGVPWLFRPWLDGVSLRVRLTKGGALPVDEAVAVTVQVAGALDALHRSGLLHRAVKPGHVILEPGGAQRAWLIDAGVSSARAVSADTPPESVPYLSPEQAQGRPASFRSDLYALGCVLHELVSGSPPFRGDPAWVLEAHLSEAPPPLPEDVPRAVRELVGRLLAKKPKDRPSSAAQVRRRLAALVPAPVLAPAATGEPPVAAPADPEPTVEAEPRLEADLTTGAGTDRESASEESASEESASEESASEESASRREAPPVTVDGADALDAIAPTEVAEVARLVESAPPLRRSAEEEPIDVPPVVAARAPDLRTVFATQLLGGLIGGLTGALIGGLIVWSFVHQETLVSASGATRAEPARVAVAETGPAPTSVVAHPEPTPAEREVAAGTTPDAEPERAETEPAEAEPAETAEPEAAEESEAAPPVLSPEEQRRRAELRASRAETAREQAREQYRSRNYAAAARAYTRASRLEPRNARNHAGAGATNLLAGRTGQAIQAYERAVRLAPRRASYHAALGAAYRQAGQVGPARRAFSRALQLDPDNRSARQGLASL